MQLASIITCIALFGAVSAIPNGTITRRDFTFDATETGQNVLEERQTVVVEVQAHGIVRKDVSHADDHEFSASSRAGKASPGPLVHPQRVAGSLTTTRIMFMDSPEELSPFEAAGTLRGGFVTRGLVTRGLIVLLVVSFVSGLLQGFTGCLSPSQVSVKGETTLPNVASECNPVPQGQLWMAHAWMIASAACSAYTAITVNILGKRGVMELDQLLCAVAERLPLMYAIIIGQGQPLFGSGGPGTSRNALVLQGIYGALVLVFYHAAIVGVNLASATAIIYSEAVWVPLAMAFLASEAFGSCDVIAVTVANLGVFCIAGTDSAPTFAVLAAVGDSAGFACMLVITRHWMPKESPWVAQHMQMLICAFLYMGLILPLRCHDEGCKESFHIISGVFGHATMSPSTRFLIWSGNLLGAMQTCFMQISMQTAPSGTVPQLMLYIYLAPILSASVGTFVLYEHIGPKAWAGICLIVVSIVGQQVRSYMAVQQSNESASGIPSAIVQPQGGQSL